MWGDIYVGAIAGMMEAKLEAEITKDMTPEQRKERWERQMRLREVRALETIARKKWSIF